MESRAGEIDLGAIGIFAAALNFAPERALSAMKLAPFAWIGQTLPSFGRGGIGRQGKHLFDGEGVHSLSLRLLCPRIF